MAGEVPPEILSSRSRLVIADLLSTRPRTLGELADKTGVSIQAVLKHLQKLDQMGMLEKKSVSGREISARKLYSLKGAHLGDYSAGSLTVVSMARREGGSSASRSPVTDLEALAEDVLVQRRRIREQARKLGRM